VRAALAPVLGRRVGPARGRVLGLLLLAAAGLGGAVLGAAADATLTFHPAMVKGRGDAAVTIVEFSDYQ
jgi:ABC-type uncharacterized transport system permease subunit